MKRKPKIKKDRKWTQTKPGTGSRGPIRYAKAKGRISLPAGIQCPQCGGYNIRVTHSYPKDGRILRRRKCNDCGKRFETWEK